MTPRGIRTREVLALSAALFLLGACGQGTQETTSPPPDGSGSAPAAPASEQPSLGAATAFIATDTPFGAFYVAEEQDLFSKHGIDLTVQAFNSGAEVIDAVRSADAGFIAVGDLPSMRVWSEGDIVGIAPLTWDTTNWSLIARPEIETPEDLRGTSVATIVGSSGYIGLVNYLEEHDLVDDVEIVNLNLGDMPAALARDEIQAYFGVLPTIDAGLAAVEGAWLLQDGSEGYLTNRIILSAARTTVDGDSRVVEAVIAALLEATDFINSNPEEASAIIAERLGLEVELAERYVSAFNFEMAYDDMFRSDLESESQAAVELDILDAEVDLGSQFDPSFLEAVLGN